MKLTVIKFLSFFILSSILALIVLQISDKNSSLVIENLKKEIETSAILSAKSVAQMKDNSFVDEIIIERKKHGIDILIAEKLLFPSENSSFVAGYSVIGSSSSDLIKKLSSLSELELLNNSLEIESGFGVIKVVNTPRRVLVAQLVDSDSINQKIDDTNRVTTVAIVAIYLLGFIGFIALIVSDKIFRSDGKKRGKKTDSNIYSSREKLLVDIENSKNPSLLLLDIRDFGKINEFYTHKVGDFFLEEFYKILGFYLPNGAKLYRLGGDEFAFLLANSSIKEASTLAETLQQNIPNESVFYEDFEISVHLSIGVASSSSNLLEKADIALKTAKKQNIDEAVLFTTKLDPKERLKHDLEWAKKINYAISKEKVNSHFQPIVDSKTGEIFAYEALVRLLDDSGEEVLPFLFLKSAKLSKQYSKLSRAMLKKTIANFSLRKENLSVNITLEDIKDKETLNFTSELIRKYDLGERIIFELNLDDKVDDYSAILEFIDELKTLNCRFAIDNFGATKINIDLAILLGVDFIKIDSTIIENIDKDKKSYLLAKAIVAFAKAQNIKTVAKFVSSDLLKEKAVEIGVDYLQGFNIAKPSNTIPSSAI